MSKSGSIKVIAINSLSLHSGLGPGRLQKGTIVFQMSSTISEKLTKDMEYYKTLGLSLEEIVAMIKKDFDKP